VVPDFERGQFDHAGTGNCPGNNDLSDLP